MTNFRQTFAVLMAALFAFSGRAEAAHPLENVHAAIAAGQVEEEEGWRLKILAIFEPSALPAPYQGEGTTHLVTLDRAELFSMQDHLSEANRALLEHYGFRRGRKASLVDEQTVTVAGFRIHYTFSGTDATNQTYLDALSTALPIVTAQYVNSLTYPLPPLGTSGLYEVYLQNLGPQSYYGYVQPEATVGDNPNTTQAETGAQRSYMVIENDLAEPVFKSPTYEKMVQNLRATFAHEYFHAIQFGLGAPYSTTPHQWLLESTATFMEETVFPDSNISYDEYMDDWFLHPDVALIATDASLGFSSSPRPQHEYGSFIFWTFLDDHEANLRAGLKEIFFRIGNGSAGSVASEVDRIFPTWLSMDKPTALHRFALANAAQVAPAQGVLPELSPITHEDAASFLPLGENSKANTPLGVERKIQFTGTAMTHDSHLSGEGNTRLGLMASDTLQLTVSSPLKITLTDSGGAVLSMSAVVGTGASARLIPSSGSPLSLTVNPADKVLLVITHLSGQEHPRYLLSLTPATQAALNCQVDGAGPFGNYAADVGDAAALLSAGPSSTACQNAACNFDLTLSNPEPGAGDVTALVNAIVSQSSLCN